MAAVQDTSKYVDVFIKKINQTQHMDYESFKTLINHITEELWDEDISDPTNELRKLFWRHYIVPMDKVGTFVRICLFEKLDKQIHDEFLKHIVKLCENSKVREVLSKYYKL